MGTGVVDAATTGGTPLLIFSLAAAGLIITVLMGLVIWFVKDRVKSRRQYEDLLEKRLSSGAETMQNLKLSVEQLQTKFVEHLGALLKREDFNSYTREHDREHNRLDDKVADVRERYGKLAERLESSVKSMSRMLAKLIKVNNLEGEDI
jgi:predicted nuclease with TOPRIM domain